MRIVWGRLGLAAATIAAALAVIYPAQARPAAFDRDVSADPTTDSGEPMVAVNPTDPANQIVTYTQVSLGSDLARQVVPGAGNLQGTTQCGFAVTRDGGLTWERRSIPSVDPLTDPAHMGCADPNVVFAPDGTAYISDGDYGPVINGDIRFITSTDKGSTWSQPLIIAHTLPEAGWSSSGAGSYVGVDTDQPWLAVDSSTGAVYVSWREYRAASGGTSPFGDSRYVAVSHDGGATFSVGAPTDSTTYPGGDAPISAANGTVAVAYVPSSASAAGGCRCVVFALSRDGGSTFSHVATPASGTDPTVAADPSHRGRYSVLALTDNATKVAVWSTDNYGASWSGPTVVVADAVGGPQNTRFKPWLAYSPDGVLGAMWRTQYSDGTYDAWAAVSHDGGSTFGSPIRISSAKSPAYPAYYAAGDDFSTVTLTPSFLYAGWGDSRSGHLDAWYGGFPIAS